MLYRQIWLQALQKLSLEQLGQMGSPRRCRRRLPPALCTLLVSPLPITTFILRKHVLTRTDSCLTARRRRKAGRKPFYGTGWAARPGLYNNQNNNQYNAQPYYANQPAPPYDAATNNNNNGYYGGGANQNYYGQQNGVELQQPQPSYGGGGYAPPPGPPPAKA